LDKEIFIDKSEVIRCCAGSSDVFWDRGFLPIPVFLSERSCEILEQEISRMSCAGIAQRLGRTDEQERLIALTDIDRISDVMFDFARNASMLQAAEAILGTRAVSLNVEYFVKPAGSEKPTPAHQDQAFLKKMENARTCSFWIALDSATTSSSALQYATKSPKMLLPHVRSQLHNFELELDDPSPFNFQTVALPRGGCVVHHSFAVHRSIPGANTGLRRALSFSYRSVSNFHDERAGQD
jgi:ectoine hydroxylase-related dioxygenase (phytanoyl-CoA dioxygenase family)